jgi:galactokinase
MTAIARSLPGCYGSRMTGAGFGGCTIALCHKDDMEKIITNVKKDYKEATGRETDIYEVHPTGGPRRIN